MKGDENIAEALGIENTPVSPNVTQEVTTTNTGTVTVTNVPSLEVTPHNQDKKDQEEDYIRTRDTFFEILESGKKALFDLSTLAEDTTNTRDAARCYEVMSGMIKALADANERVYDIHEKKQKLTGTEKGSIRSINNNIDKAVFIGTTEELVRQLRDKND